ncbi:MAG: leucyl/phenylalanyl-tRNA--protein transferase, partial [Pseudomonadota bacterium]
PLDQLHVPRRLRRVIRQDAFEVKVDTAFTAVLQACAAPSPGRENTWINDQIVSLYTGLFERGFAHSVECWRDGRLMGGLYGVAIGAAFFGESMFSRASDASKVALIHLAARLRVGGFQLLDTQFRTEHLGQFGTIEISKELYMEQLEAAVASPADFSALPAYSGGACILQSITQTS